MYPYSYCIILDRYKKFSPSLEYDFSSEAAQSMYNFETFGIGTIDISGFNTHGKKINGYAVGKKYMDITISMWKEDFKRAGIHRDLLMDSLFKDPKWINNHEWINKILGINKMADNLYKELKDVVDNNEWLRSPANVTGL